MGTKGTGSLEKSDLDSTKFWCEYPIPFLRYYYATFPDEDPKNSAPNNDNAGDVGTGDKDGESAAGDGGTCQEEDQMLKSDVHSDFTHVRLGGAL